MKVEDITNYGKGFIEQIPEIDRLKRKILFPMIKVFYRNIGIVGILKLAWKVIAETKRMKAHDWSDFERRHCFNKEYIHLLLEDMALMKVIMEMCGEDKAMKIIGDALEKGNTHLAYNAGKNIMLMPLGELKSFQNPFIAFKEYIKSIETAVVQERVHQFHIVQDTSRMFAFDVTFCILHEIAKELGNTKYCFISCHADDVVFPYIGPKLGFVYTRSRTLGYGAPCCDFRFKKV